MRIAFVSCSKTKAEHTMPAGALYSSPLYRKSLLAALDQASAVYILSAKHGILPISKPIDPYDVTIKNFTNEEQKLWTANTSAEIRSLLHKNDTAIMLCGNDYCNPLRAAIKKTGATIEEPLHMFSLGKRLKCLAEINKEAILHNQFERFLQILSRLWLAQSGGRRLSETNGKQHWPARGVYFVLESKNTSNYKNMPRIVRVGTHAVSSGSKTTLWHRLSTHRGTVTGKGSHRSSIFRLHVGRAEMIRQQHIDWPASWSQGQSASAAIRADEEFLEQRVSAIIGELSVLWLDINDEPGPKSERAYIERNAIGLLSRVGLLKPQTYSKWLGRLSPNWGIAASGLWNLNHLFEHPDSMFLNRLEDAVDKTIYSLDKSFERYYQFTDKKGQLDMFGKK